MKKIDFKGFFLRNKKRILISSAIVFAAAAGCGIWYYSARNSAEPVYVFPFEYVGMTEYWGDTQESHGPVSTDKIQTVFLTDTQTVTEVLVKEGDTVKKGDLLMSFDTTLSDLALERKRLAVEKVKLQIQDAQDRLRQIRNMKPMQTPAVPEDDSQDDESLGPALTTAFQISGQKDYDGSSPEKALICWLHSNTTIGDDIFEAVRGAAEEYQNYKAQHSTESTEPSSPSSFLEGLLGALRPSCPPEEAPETPDKPYEPFAVTEYYVVFKVTQGNRALGQKLSWQGMKVSGQGSGFRFRLTDIVISDHMLTDLSSDTDAPQIDYGSGFTATQLAEMRVEQEKKIKELEFQQKMAEAEYKIMQTEVDDGKVYAQIDGEVVSLLTEEEAKATMQPILKVSGGGGFYVEGFVNELEKDSLKIGQEVTVNSWSNGMTYTGTIASIGDFPTREGYWNGLGNPTSSYYPFRVFVDESADLQAGSYVNVVYSSAESEHGVYLQNPFLRTEKGKSYVLVLGANGKLEQRFVKTGKSLWGSYTEILEGLTPEDLVAFPYGKNVKPGVPAVEGDLSNLYN